MNPQPPYPTSEEIKARFVWGLLETKQEKEKKNVLRHKINNKPNNVRA
jgi:hypothetical protein